MEALRVIGIIIFAIIFTAVFMYFFDKRECSNSDTNKVDRVIKPFIEQIDIAFGEYSQYEVVQKLRKETIDQLKKSYFDSPANFRNFSNSIDHRLWAYKWICNITLEELGTGKHHVRDILQPEGRILVNLNRSCLQHAHQYNYISKKELDEALKSLDDQIREVGTWA
jgi:hypothetical protein